MFRAMYRLGLAIAIVTTGVACKDGLPPPPDPQRYQTLNEDERCEATAPRAIRCIDHLLLAQFRQLSSELPEGLVQEVSSARTSTSEALVMHRTSCLADDPRSPAAYADAIVACWSVEDCVAFADCVVAKQGPPRRAPAKP